MATSGSTLIHCFADSDRVMVLSMHFSNCYRRGKRDESGYTGTFLIDLSKAYECLPHDLIIAKFEAYGFDNISLRLFYSCLPNRKQRVKIGSAISEWIDILTRIPQGSILGPLIFNTFF